MNLNLDARRLANWLFGALVAALLASSFASCAVFSGRETAGEYIDDAAITTSVKAAIFDEPSLRSMQISVETFQNVVQLSGFVDSAQARNRAGEVARRVSGVRDVTNSLIVR